MIPQEAIRQAYTYGIIKGLEIAVQSPEEVMKVFKEAEAMPLAIMDLMNGE